MTPSTFDGLARRLLADIEFWRGSATAYAGLGDAIESIRGSVRREIRDAYDTGLRDARDENEFGVLDGRSRDERAARYAHRVDETLAAFVTLCRQQHQGRHGTVASRWRDLEHLAAESGVAPDSLVERYSVEHLTPLIERTL